MSLRFLSGLHKSLSTTFADKPLLFSSAKNVSLSIPTNSCYSRRNVFEASAISASLTSVAFSSASISQSEDSPFSGVEDVLTSFIFGKRKATEVAHKVWERVVQKGDTVVDATCGNGHDTLTMLNMAASESGEGCVYGFDIQRDALDSTSALLDRLATPNKKEAVKLFEKCHSKMAEVLPKDVPVRLVAFNLGYLPGGDKKVITEPKTTLEALKAAKDIVMPGGLISLVVYVGHPGGGKELETVEEFSSELPIGSWICCKFQMLNRPLCPVLIFLWKKS